MPYVELSVVHASVLSLLVISLERYHVICQPLQAGYRCTRAKATAAIAVIWTLAFLSAGYGALPLLVDDTIIIVGSSALISISSSVMLLS